MKIGKLKRKLNKWQTEIGFIRVWEVYPPKAWRFRFAVLKITQFPEEGELMEKKHYKGIFWESKVIWHPLTKIKRFLERRGY